MTLEGFKGMPYTNYEFLSSLISDKKNPLELIPEVGKVIAAHLESAVMDKGRNSLEQLSEELVEVFYAALSKSSVAVKAATINEASDVDVRSSFILGQLSFAQSLAGQFLEHRAGEEFHAVINDAANRDYFIALLKADMTNTDLAVAVGQRAETASRKLKRFRELGVTDFRRDGVKVVNFLSPISRASLEEKYSNVAVMPVVARDRISRSVGRLDEHMSHFPAFGGRSVKTAVPCEA